MRLGPLAWLGVLVGIGAIAAALWPGGDAPVPNVMPSDAATVPPPPPDATPVGAANAVEAPRIAIAPAATTRSLRLHIVDAATQTALPDVLVQAVADGRRLAQSDLHGDVDIDGVGIEDLLFVAAKYLLASFPLGDPRLPELRRNGTDDRLVIPLHADDISLPLRLEFAAADGTTPAHVRFRLTCLDPSPPNANDALLLALTTLRSPEQKAALRAHMITAQLPTAQLPVHLGVDSGSRVFACDGAAELRMIAGGDYRIEVASSVGEVARATLSVTAEQRAPIRVVLGKGLFAGGTVHRVGDDRPVADVDVVQVDPFPGAAHTRTDANGAFAIGPFPAMSVALVLRAPGYATLQVSDLRPGTLNARLALTPLPTHTVSGVVRARPGLGPIADARVAVHGSDQVWTTTTDRYGRFAIAVTQAESDLRIDAAGWMPYAEIVDPRDAPTTYDLLPAEPDARVRAGLTGMLRGSVVGADGTPRRGVTVRVFPGTVLPAGVPGHRRIRSGGVIALPHAALTDTVGEFTVECLADGPVRVVTGSDDHGGDGLIEISPGRIRTGLRLVAYP